VSSFTWGRKQIQFPKRCVFSLLFRKKPGRWTKSENPISLWAWTSFAKPVLADGLYIVRKEELSTTCYVCDTYNWRKAKHIVTCLGTETRFGLVTQFIGYLYGNYTQLPQFKPVLCTLILHFFLLTFTLELLALMPLGSACLWLTVCLLSSNADWLVPWASWAPTLTQFSVLPILLGSHADWLWLPKSTLLSRSSRTTERTPCRIVNCPLLL
jgi:hypothetical protein